MLALRPGCECCDRDLPPDSKLPLFCSYECTWCVECAETRLGMTCPNCQCNLVPRPILPAATLARHPASLEHKHRPQNCGAA